MSDVKTMPRSRRDRARATRRRILDAAYELFGEDGYVGTTMDGIARRAGVAVQTVYFVFHTKGELLRALTESTAAGETDARPVPEQSWFREALATPDPRRTIALSAEHGTDVLARLAPLIEAIRTASPNDQDLASWYRGAVRGRRGGMQLWVEALAARAALRPGLSIERATDILFVVENPETFRTLTHECRWSLVEFKAWAYWTLCEQLLSPNLAVVDQLVPPTAGLSFDSLVGSLS